MILNPFSAIFAVWRGLMRRWCLLLSASSNVDGKPIEIPEEERIGEAVLISTQLARMAGQLEKRYSES